MHMHLFSKLPQGQADPGFFGGGMASAGREHEPIWGSGGVAPSGVQGQRPWSGGQGAKPP